MTNIGTYPSKTDQLIMLMGNRPIYPPKNAPTISSEIDQHTHKKNRNTHTKLTKNNTNQNCVVDEIDQPHTRRITHQTHRKLINPTHLTQPPSPIQNYFERGFYPRGEFL